MQIERLAWDSDFFDLQIGAVYIDRGFKDKAPLMAQAKEESYDVVYGFFSVDNATPDIPIPFQHDYKTTNIKYGKSISKGNHPINEYIKEADENTDIASLKKMSLRAGHTSRFVLDKQFPDGSSERLYTTWLENSLNHTIADKVLVYQNDIVMGFVTIKIVDATAIIGLISVDERGVGLGIGSQLLDAVQSYALQCSCDRIEVGTQWENKGACSFYEKNGFLPLTYTQIYHFWIGKQ